MLIFHAIDTGVPENRYTHKRVFLLLLLHLYVYIYIPVVPLKAVAEVSKIGNL